MNLEAIREAREELLLAAAALNKVLALGGNSEPAPAPAPRLLAPQPPQATRARRKPTRGEQVSGRGESALLLRKVAEALPEPFTVADVKAAFEKQHAGAAKRASETFVIGCIMRWQDHDEVERAGGNERPRRYRRTKRWNAGTTKMSRNETAYRELRDSMKLPASTGEEEEK